MSIKKIVCIVLAIVLCITATVVVVTANAKNVVVTVVSDKTELSTGESATVSVSITTNFPVATMSIPVFYDKTLVEVSDASTTLTGYSVANTITDANSVNSTKVYADTNVSSDQYGFVLVNYIAAAGSTVAENVNGTVLTFTITAKTDVEGTALINCVTESAKTTTNADGMLYFGSTTSGTTVNSVPENIDEIDLTSASQSVVITKAESPLEPNTLVLKDEYADYGIIVDTEIAPMMACEDWYPHLVDAVDAAPTGMIYGLDTVGYDDNFGSEVYPMIADAFTTAYGDDYIEVILPESSLDGFETTGTIINVLDEDGAVVETYYFVYFGDVNGDAYMDSIDVAAASEFAFYGDTTTTVAETIAGDYNGDTYVDSIDVATMSELAFVQDGYSAQADIAEIFYATVYGM